MYPYEVSGPDLLRETFPNSPPSYKGRLLITKISQPSFYPRKEPQFLFSWITRRILTEIIESYVRKWEVVGVPRSLFLFFNLTYWVLSLQTHPSHRYWTQTQNSWRVDERSEGVLKFGVGTTDNRSDRTGPLWIERHTDRTTRRQVPIRKKTPMCVSLTLSLLLFLHLSLIFPSSWFPSVESDLLKDIPGSWGYWQYRKKKGPWKGF